MTPTAGTLDTTWERDLDEPVIALSVSSCGVIAAGSEGSIALLDAHGEARARMSLGDFLVGMAVSPDGTRLAAGGGDRVAVWDLASGAALRERAAGWCSALTWNSRSDRLAIGDGRQVRVLDRDGGVCWTSPPLPSTVTGLAWMREDGRRIAAAAYQGVSIFEPAGDRLVEHLPAPGAIAGLAVSPNGRWVVGGSQDATLHGWKVPGGDDFQMSGFPTTVSQLAFDATGRWMACDGGDTIAFWDFSGRGPTGRQAVLGQDGHAGVITAFTWSRYAGGTRRELFSADSAGGLAAWRLDPSTTPGRPIRSYWSSGGADPVTALVETSDCLISGHQSGVVRACRRP